jgi:hypothetical protein
MTTLPPLSTVPTRRDGVRWITLLLAGAGVAFPFVAWLAGPDRWWSAFIFLPAFVLIGFGLIQVRLGGRLAGWIVRASLGLGAIVMTLALIFAFSMDWHYAWTLMLIMPGLVIALYACATRKRRLWFWSLGHCDWIVGRCTGSCLFGTTAWCLRSHKDLW